MKKYSKGRYKRRGSVWFAYAVAGLPTSIEPRQIFEMYRLRFGIESGYRQMNQVRAHTTSRNPIIRLLLVGFAFILFNLYIASRQQLAICGKTASLSFSKLWLTLRHLAHMLAHAVEISYGFSDVVLRHPDFTFS